MTNCEWLLENASAPIRYNLAQDQSLVDELLSNDEVLAWMQKLIVRVDAQDLSNIHGSHDYRYENIIKKSFILGLNRDIPQFDCLIRFFINFLDEHIMKTYVDTLTLGRCMPSVITKPSLFVIWHLWVIGTSHLFSM